METIKWVLCPICGNKTRTIMQEDTELKNFPLYCPKCKQQTLVNVKRCQKETPAVAYAHFLDLSVSVAASKAAFSFSARSFSALRRL